MSPAAATLDIGFHSGLGGGMNNQEVTMHSPLPSTGLIAHHKALETAGIAIQLLDDVRAITWRLLHPRA
jgi:hypothetical protein